MPGEIIRSPMGLAAAVCVTKPLYLVCPLVMPISVQLFCRSVRDLGECALGRSWLPVNPVLRIVSVTTTVRCKRLHNTIESPTGAKLETRGLYPVAKGSYDPAASKQPRQKRKKQTKLHQIPNLCPEV